MFSGIVEAVGVVVDAAVGERGGRLVIDAGELPLGSSTTPGGVESQRVDRNAGFGLGDSIAVNGVCLTIERIEGSRFQATTMLETLRRTNLGALRPGDRVNLERALAADGRLGGHIVQGHVDGTAELVAVAPDGESLRLRYAPPPALMRYLVEKGFVAVDGVSLTVTDVDDSTFGIALVRYTQEHTVLVQPVGYRANVEVDVLAKYVERLIHAAGYDRRGA